MPVFRGVLGILDGDVAVLLDGRRAKNLYDDARQNRLHVKRLVRMQVERLALLAHFDQVFDSALVGDVVFANETEKVPFFPRQAEHSLLGVGQRAGELLERCGKAVHVGKRLREGMRAGLGAVGILWDVRILRPGLQHKLRLQPGDDVARPLLVRRRCETADVVLVPMRRNDDVERSAANFLDFRGHRFHVVLGRPFRGACRSEVDENVAIAPVRVGETQQETVAEADIERKDGGADGSRHDDTPSDDCCNRTPPARR